MSVSWPGWKDLMYCGNVATVKRRSEHVVAVLKSYRHLSVEESNDAVLRDGMRHDLRSSHTTLLALAASHPP